ncbi:MAG: ATP-binding cassette domain-containing protein [Chloroflexi bacterium]|nr:ATP-binding cassette domain-containing protein [Chloroflexota bacterium]
MSDIAIRAENLSKSYKIAHSTGRSSYRTLQEELIGLVKRPFNRNAAESRRETFWALKDISFEVKHGEVLGIIGRNGAGKSTLLKILSRITKPTSGRADIYGRVGSLLEVGTGFHPELTGRENIYLNGAVLGMTRRDIQKHFDEIVAFAEVEQFLDTPVKRYSSGMYMRLAFAVAAHLEPEVLVVDEVLAVGDAKFQEKCLGKMSDVAKSGRTVLFVSHNMGAIIALCRRGIVLENGTIAFSGEISRAVAHYLNSAELSGVIERPEPALPGKLHIQRVSLLKDLSLSNSFTNSETLTLRVECRVYQLIREAQIAFDFSVGAGECLFSSTSQDFSGEKGELAPGDYIFECPINLKMFRQGQYTITVASSVPNVEMLDLVPQPLIFEIFDDSSPILRLGQERRGMIVPNFEWNVVTHAAQTATLD